MINVRINVSTNASEDEKKKLYIPKEAIDEFLGEGFASNKYDGEVTFRCEPRAINPDWLEAIIEYEEVLDVGLPIVIGALVKFFKKCLGYEKVIRIHRKKNGDEFECIIPVNKNSDEEKILKEIRKMMK